MEFLFDHLKAFFEKQGIDKTYWIAYSGGLDSHVLLHLCARLHPFYPIRFNAIHINHGLSPNADAWALHCATVCNDLQIHFQQKKLTIDLARGQSLEEVAREYRYAQLADLLTEGDILLTAHQQEDQAETVLLQLFRGSGPKGLAAMPMIKPFAAGFHARPLLGVSREELQQYAKKHQLTWIEDETNADPGFTRNFLRHEIFPILKKRWPSIAKTLARTAENFAEAQHLLETVAKDDLENIKGSSATQISIPSLLRLSKARQRQVLREWMSQLQFPLPSEAKLQQIQKNILHAAEDKLPHIVWGNVEIRRYQEQLYIMKRLPKHNIAQMYDWDMRQSLLLPGVGKLHVELTQAKGLRADIKNIQVRFRQGGEWCQLAGRSHRHELKKLLQQWGVPPWERSRIPLLYMDDVLIAVVGYYIDEKYMANSKEDGYLVHLTNT